MDVTYPSAVVCDYRTHTVGSHKFIYTAYRYSVTGSRGTVSQRKNNDSVKFQYYPFEALGRRRQEAKKEEERKTRLKVGVAIYSEKTKFYIFTNVTGTAP
jgi:hypothetical protein